MLKSKNKAKVLIASLDWGLGHASRDIEIINYLIERGHEVIIAADKLPLKLLQEEFSELQFIRFPSCIVKYSRKYLIFRLFIQIPKIIKGIVREHKELKEIIKKHNIDLVISDNRYGLWNKKVKTVFITHQVMIKLPRWLKIFEYSLYRFNRLFIEKFDECWIPDYPSDNNLSGDLSHKYRLPSNAAFIGPLSRFKRLKNMNFEKGEPIYDILIVLSGPEPHRSILENILMDQLVNSQKKCLVVRGIPGNDKLEKVHENVKTMPHLTTEEMANAMLNTEIIICRSGYTSIMDLIALNKRAILIPTPGQTEQEYLAEYLKERNIFYSTNQSEFDLDDVINEFSEFVYSSFNFNKDALNTLLDKIFKKLIKSGEL